MKVISRPRAGGKTTELIDQFRADPRGIFITDSGHVARSIRGRVGPAWRDRVLSWEEWLGSKGEGLRNRNLYIDNIDVLLRVMLRLSDSRIATVTLTDDERDATRNYDPEHDLPPRDAVVEDDGIVIRWHAERGWWRIEEGPAHRLGAVAYPFSSEGIAIGKMYARRKGKGA